LIAPFSLATTTDRWVPVVNWSQIPSARLVMLASEADFRREPSAPARIAVTNAELPEVGGVLLDLLLDLLLVLVHPDKLIAAMPAMANARQCTEACLTFGRGVPIMGSPSPLPSVVRLCPSLTPPP
jgi:hypothetical protein